MAQNATAQQQDKLFDDICQQSQNFEHYEKLFQEVLMDLEGDETLETFRREYESLHNSFLKCHEGEKRLIKKCIDLSQEITSCQLKVKAAEELSHGDQSTIDQLRKEITKARGKVQQSKETEVHLKEKIKQLKLDIKELDKQVEKGATGVVGHDTTIADLTRVRQDLQKEHETQASQLVAIQHDITHLQSRVAKVQGEKANQDNEFRLLKEAIESKNNELEDQRVRKERKERELKGLKEELAKNNKQISEQQAALTQATLLVQRLEEQLVKTKSETEKVIREYSAINKKTQRFEQELDELIEKNGNLQTEIQNLTMQLKAKDQEVSNLRKEESKQAKLCEAINRRNIALESQRADAESQRNALRLEIQQMELSMASGQKHAENDRKQIEDLTRERDILNKNYLKAQSSTQRQKDWLIVKENQRRNLDHQLRGYERHAQKQRELIHQLTKESQLYEEDARDAARKYLQALEDVKGQETVIVDHNRSIQDSEQKLKQQQTYFDNVLNERNLFSKQLLEQHADINEMKRKFKIMLRQIGQLKEEIQTKEKHLVEEERVVKRLKKEKREHEMDIVDYQNKTEKKQRDIAVYSMELHKLNQIIAEAETEKSKQQRDHINVMNERDILGAQLIKRNDELAHLYERIRIQQSTLRKGEAQYNERLQDIQNLNLRVHQLRNELSTMRQFASRLPELKLLVNKTQRELSREQCRVRNLLDECDNPLNVHRWRRLEGSEPHMFEMLQKIQALQRELIAKNNELGAKNKLIAEKEKLYLELKGIIARQPGPEVAEQLNVYQDNIQKKSSQMKAMKSSLKHFQEQVDQHKSRVEELQGEMSTMKQMYAGSLNKKAQADDRQRILNEMMGKSPDSTSGGAGMGGTGDVYVGYTAPPRPDTDDLPPLPEGEGTATDLTGPEAGTTGDELTGTEGGTAPLETPTHAEVAETTPEVATPPAETPTSAPPQEDTPPPDAPQESAPEEPTPASEAPAAEQPGEQAPVEAAPEDAPAPAPEPEAQAAVEATDEAVPAALTESQEEVNERMGHGGGY